METREVFIKSTIYENPSNGYQVLHALWEEKELILVGTFRTSVLGLCLKVSGEMEYREDRGWQFQVKSYEVVEPSDEESIRRYLSSGAIKGIGEALAARIVKAFGEETMDVILKEPEKLATIKGISLRKAQDISVQVEEKQEMQGAMLFLQKYGISNQLAVKIYQEYGNRLYGILQENPYQMAEDIEGVGFKTADQIACQIGIKVDSEYRIRSGILYEMSKCLSEGNTFLYQPELVERVCQLLEVNEEMVIPQISNLIMDRKLISKKEKLFSQVAYYAELYVATKLFKLAAANYSVSEEAVSSQIQRIEQKEGIVLDDLQRLAVMKSIQESVMILTGGPGTGKTTTIQVMIEYFLSRGMDLALCAPTGRAAKRMTEATGYEAKTIHRLLEVNADMSQDGAYFERGEDNPLEVDVIIVDETSMVDIFLMQALLKAVSIGTRVVFVGDMNQLPSVGPGQVIRDMIDSHCFSCVQLEKIFRQAESSDIIKNAHRIKEGKELVIDNQNSRDFFLLERRDVNLIYNNIVKLVLEKLPGFVDADPYEIQVMTPMKKGPLGVLALNEILQKYLNPPSAKRKEHQFGEKLLREGDKVMQIKNNYKLEWEIVGRYNIPLEKGEGVFNGDVGRIIEIRDFDKIVKVEFDERRQVEYPFSMVEELELAYAITVHKSQGSEYPAVILTLLGVPKLLSYRNLLYTAITRAKKCVTILGPLSAAEEMIQNENEQKRNSGLCERILEQVM